MKINKNSKIFIASYNGMVGFSIKKKYGWKSKTSLKEDLYKTLEDFKPGYRK